MSKSKLPIPNDHKETALKALKGRPISKIFITEDGHLYVPDNKHFLDYHCKTNGKTYWEVEAPEEAVAEKEDKVENVNAEVKAEGANPAEEKISAEQQAKINEAAKAAGAPDAALIEKLKGQPIDKLVAQTKEVLLGYAADLKISVSETDTKQVIAEEILKAVNA